MIVDDEEEVREAIKCKLPWEELGFVVVDTAENGEEALEKAECIFPDVVLTDIQMPFMDGLTFCHKLREIMSNVKILIFSGYDEFEYAKEAIRVEAEEYLLKPVSREELRQSFLRLKTLLDEEMAERKNIDRLKQYYESSLPVLKEQFLVGVLDGRFKKMELYEYNKQYGETETDDTYQVLVFLIHQVLCFHNYHINFDIFLLIH